MKKISRILILAGILIISLFAIFGKGIGEDKSNDLAKEELSVPVASNEEFINSINNATKDFSKITVIELTEDITVSGNITINPGANIVLRSKAKDFEIGQYDAGYTLNLSSASISLSRQTSLVLDVNVKMDSSSIQSIAAESETDDFYPTITINDSVTMNSNSTISSALFKTDGFVINGTINVRADSNNTILSANDGVNANIATKMVVNEDAAIIVLTNGATPTISGQFTGKGAIFTTGNAYENIGISSFGGYSLISSLSGLNQGNYILDYNVTVSNTYTLSSGTCTIIPFGDIKISSTSSFVVSSNATLNLGGFTNGSTHYSAGSNMLIIDGGAVWNKDSSLNSNNIYFVNDDFEYTDGADNINASRWTYTNSGAKTDLPLIAAQGTLNTYRGVVLQNRDNQLSVSDSPAGYDGLDFGGGIRAVGTGNNSRAVVNIYGSSVLYNYINGKGNSNGGAGISAKYANVTMYGGRVDYNSSWNNEGGFDATTSSIDGTGVALVYYSDLVMYDGASVSYNHGPIGYSADGAGIMVRESSMLTIEQGVVSNNFAYGYGGAICVYNSDVTINNGVVSNNRATFGGGIATSGEATITIGENENADLLVSGNYAYVQNGKDSGFGGGVALGNTSYKTNQSLIINGGEISNNYATYGGGICNYTSSASNTNSNTLTLSGGTITNNKASNSANGDGIYVDNEAENRNITNWFESEPVYKDLIKLSGSAKVDTSNNIVISKLSQCSGRYTVKQIPISVTGELTTDGIIGLIRFTDETSYNGNSIITFADGLTNQSDKFLLDSSNYYLSASDNNLNIVSSTDSPISVKINGNTQSFNNFTSAMAAITANGQGDYTILVNRNLSLTELDLISVPSGYNITIKSADDSTKTLAISSGFKFDSTTISKGIIVIAQNASVTLNNVIFDGNQSISDGFSFVYNLGTFTLSENSQLVNNISNISGGAISALSGSNTNIYGIVRGNKGPNGGIDIQDRATVTIGSTAIIENNTSLNDNANIGITNYGNLIIDGNSTIVDEIYYQQGIMSINSEITEKTFNVRIGESQYKANTRIFTINYVLVDSTKLAEKFNLVNKKNDSDSFSVISIDGKSYVVLDRVVSIEINFGEDFDDTNINTLQKLSNLQLDLGLKEELYLHDKNLVVYFHSTENVNLATITAAVAKPGYTLTTYEQGGIYHNSQATIGYPTDDGNIFLNAEWTENTYTFIFDKGLSFTEGSMANETYKYETGFGDYNYALPYTKFYTIGYTFVGWKAVGINGEYKDIIDIDKEIDKNLILALQENCGFTITLVAQWKSIFGDENLTNSGKTENDPFKISTTEGLEVLARTVNGDNISDLINGYNYFNGEELYSAFNYSGYFFILTSDIGSTENPVTYMIGSGKQTKNIAGIGGSAVADVIEGKPFSGSFDGNNHSITVNISNHGETKADAKFTGLFAYLAHASIKNLTVSGYISGDTCVGGIAGFVYGGNYSNLTNNATVEAAGSNAGGVFSTFYVEEDKYTTSSISNVINNGNVSYIGDLEENVDWQDNWSEDKIFPEESVGFRFGGIVGQTYHANITGAYNTGSITARYAVGGIIGSMNSLNDTTTKDSIIYNAFNTGSVTATAGIFSKKTYNITDNNNSIAVNYFINAYVGGIVGRLFGASEIQNAANSGNVTASYVGKVNSNDTIEYININDTNSSDDIYVGARGAGGIIGLTSVVLGDDDSTTVVVGGNKKIDYVYNTGKISAWSHVGGIAGLLAYSELNYAYNGGELTATGFSFDSNRQKVAGGFVYDYDDQVRRLNYIGAISGFTTGSTLGANVVYAGDINYVGVTESIIKAIGNDIATELDYPGNTDNSRKLSVKELVVGMHDTKPSGLGSTFYDTNWRYLSYDSTDEEKVYYYPQLRAFAEKNLMITADKTLADISKESTRVTYTIVDESGNESDTELKPTKQIAITIKLNGGLITETTTNGIVMNDFGFNYNDAEYVGNGDEYTIQISFESDILEALTGEQVSKLGYTFAGWYKDSAYAEKFDFNNLPSSDCTIYAKWDTIIYQIMYSGLGVYANGNVKLDSSTSYATGFSIDDKNKRIELPTAENITSNGAYAFEKWTYYGSTGAFDVTAFELQDDNTITLYNGNAIVLSGVSLDNIEFYISCTEVPFNIVYDLDGGTNSSNNPSTYTINENITFMDPTRVGHTFIGWFNEDGTQVYGIARGTIGEFKVKAKWQTNEYPIYLDLRGQQFIQTEFEYNGELYTLKRDSNGRYFIYFEYGFDISRLINSLPELSAPEGNSFKGWSTSTDSYVQPSLEEMPDRVITLYANYETKTYTITLDLSANLGSNVTLTIDAKYIENLNSNYLQYEISLDPNKVLITNVKYGDDISDLLNELVDILTTNNDLHDYRFVSFKLPQGFSIYNVKGDSENIEIGLEFGLNVYVWIILDRDMSIIGKISNEDENFKASFIVEDIISYLEGEGHNFEKPGYTFTNMFYDLNSGTDLNGELQIESLRNIVAKYTPNVYTVNFSEAEISSGTLSYGMSYGANFDGGNLPMPVKLGYRFVGWSLENDNRDKIVVASDIFIPEDPKQTEISLYAIFDKITYTISYNNLNGTTAPELTSYSVDDFDPDLGLILPAPTTSADYGYEFAGWYTDANYQNRLDTITIDNMGNYVLYAKWEPKEVRIVFDATENGYFTVNEDDLNRGVIFYNDLSGEKVLEGQARYFVVISTYGSQIVNSMYPTTNPSLEGYSFARWTGGATSVSQVSDIVFSANYNINTYIVSFSTGVATSINPIYVEHGNTIGRITAISKEGHTFAGWYTSDGVLFEVGITIVTSDLTLEARWEAQSYELTIVIDYENSTSSIQSAIEAKLLELGFENISWVDNKLTISVSYDTQLAILNSISVNDIYFDGWYSNGNRYVFTSMPAGNLEVTAKFQSTEIKQATIDAGGNIGTFNLPFTDLGDGTYVLSLPTISREGYNFVGWYYEGQIVDSNTKFDTTQNVIITARWEAKEYNLTYSLLGNVITIKVEYGEYIYQVLNDNVINATLANPGFVFDGWLQNNVKLSDVYSMPSYDITITDSWVPVTYGIIWHFGETEHAVDIQYNAIVNYPNYTKDYYTVSWYLGNGTNMGEEFKLTRMPNLNDSRYYDYLEINGDVVYLHISAVETEIKYSIKIDANGGMVDYDVVVFTVSNAEITLPASTKEYNSFIGYSYNGMPINDYRFESIIALFDGTNVITVRAEYELTSYQLKMEDQFLTFTVDDNGVRLDFQKPTKDGHVFRGYSLIQNPTIVEYNDYIPIDILKAEIEKLSGGNTIELYPVFELDSFKISFNTNGGNSIGEITLKFNQTIDLSGFTPVRSGYKFVRWTYEGDDVPPTMPATNIEVVAEWELEIYTITYILNGGTLYENAPDTYSVEGHVTFENASKEGFVFVQWTLNGTSITQTNGLTGNITIVANFSEDIFEISYAEYSGQKTSVEYGKPVGEMFVPTKEGKTFVGWYYGNQLINKDTIYIYTGGIEVEAHWTDNWHTVTFDSNGGSNISSILVKYGEDLNASLSTFIPTLTGYTFVAWTDENGDKLTTMPDSDITVNATWEAIEYSISFQTNGGSSLETVKIAYQDSINWEAYVSEKTGYKFDGWTYDGGELPSTMPAYDITVVASWEANKYTITFEGYDIDSITVTYGEAVEGITNPQAVEGQTFKGWEYNGVKIDNGFIYIFTNDIELSAEWVNNFYTITFDTDGGSNIPSILVEYNAQIELSLYKPYKEGHTFAGWTYNSRELPTTMPAGDIEVKANWTINKYYVIFDTQGGTNLPNASFEYGANIDLSSYETIRTGYTFAGWTLDGDYKTMPAKNIKATANWTPIEYIISFTNVDENFDDITTNYNSIIYNLPTPERLGYTFNGWYYDGILVTNGSTYIFASNIDLEAKWTKNRYTVTFDTDDGSKISSIKLDYGSNLDLLAFIPTRTGYEFVKWTLEDGSELPATMPDYDIEVKAIWSVITYTITYNLNGGTYEGESTYTVEQLVEFGTPTRTGYSFTGWTVNGNVVTSTDGLTGNITVVANWKANEYTITFDCLLDEINLSYNDVIPTLPRPTKDGYTFIGWYLDGTKVIAAGQVYNYTENLVLEAHWTPIKYKVTFDTDGGSTITSILVACDADLDLKAFIPTKVGYEFAGWTYNDGDVPTTMPAGNIEVKANWNVIEYTITYELNNGIYAGDTKYSVEKLVEFGIPRRPGYSFVEWRVNGVKETSTEGYIGDITVVAIWSTSGYKVIFDTNGGDKINDVVLSYGTAIDLSGVIPTRTGYEFVKWTLEDGSELPATMPDYDITVKANWTVITYTITYNLNGGTLDEAPDTYSVENHVVFKELTASKEGYKFIRWTVNGIEVENTNDLTGNITVVANWEANSYKITFDSLADEIHLSYNDVIPALPTPTKSGYTFAGWYLDETKVIAAGQVYNYTENLVLIAHWTPIKYKVTFNTDGGSTITSILVACDADLDLKAFIPTKVGYDFAGWTYNDGDVPTTMPAGNIEVKANWTVIEYTITYELNNGIYAGDTKYSVEKLVEFGTPERAGYEFAGWTVNGIEVSNTDGLTGNITVVANWEVENYTITFDGLTNEIDISYNDVVPTLPTPTMEGYTFDGWYVDGKQIVVGQAYTFTNSVKLEARWTVNNYVITFDTDGGSTIPAILVAYGDIIDLSAYAPTKLGYTFAGWSYNGEELPTTMPNVDIIVVAKWQLADYKITYNLNGGTYEGESSYNVESHVVFGIPTKSGYEFVGWKYNGAYIDSTNSLADNIVVEAIFKEAQYTISYEGYTDFTTKVTYNGQVGNLYIPTKDGYVFDGWYYGDTLISYDTIYTYTDNIKLTAAWRILVINTTTQIDGNDIQIKVESTSNKGFSLDTRVIIEMVEFKRSDNVYDMLKDIGRLENLYNIYLTDGNGVVTVDSSITITIAFEGKKDSSYIVVYVSDDYTSFKEVESYYDGSFIKFNTDHLSFYGIVMKYEAKALTGIWIIVLTLVALGFTSVIIAIYKNRKYTLRFVTYTDDRLNAIHLKEHSLVILPNLQREGYRFDGWYLDEAFTKRATLAAMPKENVVLFAKWSLLQ